MSIAADVYRTALNATKGLDVRVLLTVGRRFDRSRLGAIPPNVRVEAWVDQANVLDQADLVVCHGGSGTAFGALAAGVPVVAVPLFAEPVRERSTDRRPRSWPSRGREGIDGRASSSWDQGRGRTLHHRRDHVRPGNVVLPAERPPHRCGDGGRPTRRRSPRRPCRRCHQVDQMIGMLAERAAPRVLARWLDHTAALAG